MLWTEKYRPQRINEIIGQNHFTMDANAWIEERNMPNVLIFGNPGNGKTTAGMVVAKEILGETFQDNYVEVNASMTDVINSILHREEITHFSQDEIGSFIYAMNGDMRRAITELQAAKATDSTLNKQIAISLTDYNTLLISIINKNSNSLDSIHTLLHDGKTIKEVCIGLHDAVINSEGLDNNIKFKFLRTLGESEWRSNTMTPKLLASWLIGQLL